MRAQRGSAPVAVPMSAQKRAASGSSGGTAAKKSAGAEANLTYTVRKALYDNFRGWPEELVYVKQVDGVTLHDKVWNDKKR